MKTVRGWVVMIGLMCLVACGSSGTTGGGGTVDTDLVGDWRILTETVYYDSGLTQQITPVTMLVVLDAAGTWQFGSSSGAWSVSTIETTDWTSWAIDDYGATRKLTLDNWNSDTSKGPIDEPTGVIDNVWIIYSTTSDTLGTGTIWMKLGRS
ncbi:MAG: hypothetical protein HYV02_00690 [Deltaproteobacteria bacterium]|nr:hypothetical protein [Deltaproteobacteria bacterium]